MTLGNDEAKHQSLAVRPCAELLERVAKNCELINKPDYKLADAASLFSRKAQSMYSPAAVSGMEAPPSAV